MSCYNMIVQTFAVAVLIHGSPTTIAGSRSTKSLPSDGIITEPGHYQLEQDLVVARDTGVTITADDVTFDLGGHALRFRAEPREGSYGILVNGRKNIRITNGSITAFWFNIHCIDSQGLRVDHVRFDDIPYIAVNIAGTHNVLISDNTFTHFRYEIPKPKNDRYVIGINIGAVDAVIAHNHFNAHYAGKPEGPDLETVFILFSADISKGCVVTHNQMVANTLLNRSYGIWTGSNTHVTIAHNTIHNMKYGLCLGENATAMAGSNQFSINPSFEDAHTVETFGIHAAVAKKIWIADNEFENISTQVIPPKENHEKQ